jgi:hypothetical protein
MDTKTLAVEHVKYQIESLKTELLEGWCESPEAKMADVGRIEGMIEVLEVAGVITKEEGDELQETCINAANTPYKGGKS